jgi:hypothetical protein
MHIAFDELPSPLTGEDSGWGKSGALSSHPNLPPHRGEGVLTSPVQGKGVPRLAPAGQI